jgi:hypothetical protein
VLGQAHCRLQAIRQQHPDAAGLAIATDLEHARGIAHLLRERLRTRAEVVTSDDPTASGRIARFATGDAEWLVAVRMVSEGVDIPRLRVGVYATTVSTELFFRQAVGRFVRWTHGRASQKAYVYIPDDPRLRTHAFQIADARRHVLRKPGEDLDEALRRETDPAVADAELDALIDAEQLSLFSVLSAVATQVRVHTVTPEGLAFDDEPDVPEPLFEVDWPLVDLPEIATEAGWSVSGDGAGVGATVAERKDQLRRDNAAVALRLVDLTGWNHAKVNAEMNRLAGVASVASATTDQLERRLRYAESWLRRTRTTR